MNPNTREFEEVTSETPEDWKRFEVGEIIDIKGVAFVVESIRAKELKLRPATRTEERHRMVGLGSSPKAESYTERLERKIREHGYKVK